jgi:hypothetical protein
MDILNLIRYIAIFLLWSMACHAENQKPNFVIILTDDQGWNALSVP